MVKSQHHPRLTKVYCYTILPITLLLVFSQVDSSEIKSNPEQVSNNSLQQPNNIRQEEYRKKKNRVNQSQITPILSTPLKKKLPLPFKDRLSILLNHSKAPFLAGASYEAYADNLLIEKLTELKIAHLQEFLKDIDHKKSQVLWKLNSYPKLKKLTLFIADNWFLLENTHHLLQAYLKKKYQLSQEEIALLRNEIYHAIATILYLPKQRSYHPLPCKANFQKAQQKLFSLLKFSEQLYCALGEYDPYIMQAIADNTLCSNLASIQKTLLQQNQNPLTPYYQYDQEALKRISKLTAINELPALSCQNYLNRLFTQNLAEDLSSIYYQNTKQAINIDRARLMNIVDDNLVSENDINETIDNLRNLENVDTIDEYLDDDEQLFCQQEHIKQSLKDYKQLLIYYRQLATQIDQYLYHITSTEKYDPRAAIDFFQKPKSLYLLRYFKILFAKKRQEKIGGNKDILAKNSLLDAPLIQQLTNIVTHSLDLQINKTLQDWIVSQYNLTSKEQQMMIDYTFHECCSREVPVITMFVLPILSNNLNDAWKQYILNTNWLHTFMLAWSHMQYPYQPHHFFPLIKNNHLMKKLGTPFTSYENFKKLLRNHFQEISKIYQNTLDDSKMYILAGINKIIVDNHQNYLASSNVRFPFLSEYNLTHYFYDNIQKIGYLVMKVIFPNTHQKVLQQITNHRFFGMEQLYRLRQDIQSKKSKLLSKIFIASLSQQPNAKEEIIRRINAYIEAMLLFKSILFPLHQIFDRSYSNGYTEYNSNFPKKRIGAFKAILQGILKAAEKRNQIFMILENPIECSHTIWDNMKKKNFGHPRSILQNLDLPCYQEMLTIILTINHLEDYQSQFWYMIKKCITDRSHAERIIPILKKLIYQLAIQEISTLSYSHLVDKKIINQYIILVQQYLALLNILQLSGVRKHRLARIILPILKDATSKISKKKKSQLLVQNIISMHDIKLLMSNKDSLQLTLSQSDWGKIKDIITQEKIPAQFLAVPMEASGNRNKIKKEQSPRRSFTARNQLIKGDEYTSPKVGCHSVNLTPFLNQSNSKGNLPSYLIFCIPNISRSSKLYTHIYNLLRAFPYQQSHVILNHGTKHIVCSGSRGIVHMIKGPSYMNATPYQPTIYTHQWISNDVKESLTLLQHTDHLDVRVLKSYYWWQNNTYFVIWYLILPIQHQIKIQSFDMNNKLLENYNLYMEGNYCDLIVKTLDENYFIIGQVPEEGYIGSIFLFEKGNTDPLCSLSDIKLSTIESWAYSSKAKILFCSFLNGSIDAYALSKKQFKKISKPKEIKGDEALISPTNHTEKSFVLISLNIEKEATYYGIYHYRVKIEENNTFTIEKIKRTQYFLIPITTQGYDDYKARFNFFCSPKQPNYLFILTLEKLLMLNRKTWKIESTILILRHPNCQVVFTSYAGISISSEDFRVIYALTWEELAKLTKQKHIH